LNLLKLPEVLSDLGPPEDKRPKKVLVRAFFILKMDDFIFGDLIYHISEKSQQIRIGYPPQKWVASPQKWIFILVI
jgi:hypothetical protein